MKYENAGDVLPEELLHEVRKYAAGKLLYIPSGVDKRAWGETSGYRDQLQKRNRMIRNKYAHGLTVSELADEYYLSIDSIKKIIYAKKNDSHFTYYPTVESAVHYASGGLLEEWIQCFLLLSRKDAALESNLSAANPLYYGVIKFPLRLIQRDPIEQERVQQAGEAEDPANGAPPLLVQYEEGKFYCNLQRELFAALKRNRVNAYPTIIVLNGNADYKRFMTYYGSVLYYV